MFERFTRNARAVVKDADSEARRLGSRTIEAEQLHVHRAEGTRRRHRRPAADLRDQAQAVLLEAGEGGRQLRGAIRRDLDAQNPRELSGQLGHAAFEPVAAMGGHGGGHGLHETGAVGADEGDDDVGHGARYTPLSVAA